MNRCGWVDAHDAVHFDLVQLERVPPRAKDSVCANRVLDDGVSTNTRTLDVTAPVSRELAVPGRLAPRGPAEGLGRYVLLPGTEASVGNLFLSWSGARRCYT